MAAPAPVGSPVAPSAPQPPTPLSVWALRLTVVLAFLIIFFRVLWPWWFPSHWAHIVPIGRWFWTGIIAGEFFAGSVLVSRLYWRAYRRASTVWDEIVFFQTDQITPSTYTGILDQIYEAIQVRHHWWNTSVWYRLFVGQNIWSLNVWRDPQHPDAPQALHIVLAGPRRIMPMVESALQSHYTNLRFVRRLGPPDILWPYLLRWQLRYQSPLHLLRMPSNANTIPLESLAQQLAASSYPGTPPPFHFQLLMMPVPTQRARKQVTNRLNIAQWEEFATEKHAADQARTQIGNGRFRTEWRAGAQDYAVLQRLAGVWQAENRHAELRTHNVVIWRGLWRRWLRTNVPRLWPFVGGPTLWAGELTPIILLPTGFIRVPDIVRSMTRRMPAALAIARDSLLTRSDLTPQGIMEAEPAIPDLPRERVGVWEEDRHKNILLLGIQGSGKSTNLINLYRTDILARNDQGQPRKAVILFDIGKDTGYDALRCTPPEREVIWFRPSHPQNPWMIQPLSSVAADATKVDQVLQMLVDVFGTDAIRDRSKMLLGNAIRAIIDVEGERASFVSLHKMITDSNYRDMIVDQIRNEQTRHFWEKEFADGLANNPGFWEEALAAPRNKLDALLRNDFIKGSLDAATASQYLRHAIDWDRVIRDRQVVILNINKDELGAEATRLFGIAALLNLWYAIQRQQQLQYEARTPVSLLIDEAQNFLSPTFTSMLTEGRAYGLQAAIAVRFLMEIKDPIVQGAIVNLCQNRIIHRISLVDEAKTLMHLGQQLYMNNITLNEDVQSITNFAADDYMHLADRTAICMWQAHGVLQPPFFAHTIDWRPYAHDDWAAYHLDHQSQFFTPSAEHVSPNVPPSNTSHEEKSYPANHGSKPDDQDYNYGPGQEAAAHSVSPSSSAVFTETSPVSQPESSSRPASSRLTLQPDPPGLSASSTDVSAETQTALLLNGGSAPATVTTVSTDTEERKVSPQETPSPPPPSSAVRSLNERLQALTDKVQAPAGPLRSWLQRNPTISIDWLERIVPEIIQHYADHDRHLSVTLLMMEIKRRARTAPAESASPNPAASASSALHSDTDPEFLQ